MYKDLPTCMLPMLYSHLKGLKSHSFWFLGAVLALLTNAYVPLESKSNLFYWMNDGEETFNLYQSWCQFTLNSFLISNMMKD